MKNKRMLALLLAVCMVVSMFPAQALALAEGTPDVPTWGSGAAVTASPITPNPPLNGSYPYPVTSMTVTWPAATGADSYKLTYSNKTGGVMTVNNTISNIAYSAGGYTITGLTGHYRYDVSVVPVNSAGEGAALKTTSVTTGTSDGSFTMTIVPGTYQSTTSRYGSLPISTKNTSLSTATQTVYNINSPVMATGSNRTHFFWYSQSGFNNSNANNNFKAMRLFDLTTNNEISLVYGADSDFGIGYSGWTNYSTNPFNDAGDTISYQKSAGDFIASEGKVPGSGSVWIRFEANIGKYLQPGHSYAITVDPQFYSGGNNALYLNTVNRYLFTVADSTAPTFDSGAQITSSDITTTGFTASYPAATDDVGVSKYAVKLTKVSDSSIVSNSETSGLTKSFTNLDPGTEYVCEVTAKDAAGNASTPLSLHVATVADTQAPSFDAGAQIAISNVAETGFKIAYPAASDDSGVSKYIVTLTKSDATPVSTVDNTSLTKTFAGLDAGTGYAVSVVAVDSVGRQSAPLTANVSTLADGNAPTWDSGDHLTASFVLKDGFTISYPAANDDVKVAKYVVTVLKASDNSFVQTTETTELSKEITGLDIHTEYVCQVVAVDASGNSSDALSKNITTLADATSPVWNSGSQATIADVTAHGFTVSYPAATDDVKVTKYVITILKASDNSVVQSVESTSLSKTVTGLEDGTEFICQVAAMDAAGNASEAISANITTVALDKAAPQWVSGSVVTGSGFSQTGFTVNYPAAVDNFGVAKYTVTLTKVGDSTPVSSVETTELSKTYTGLDIGTKYISSIVAEDEAGNESIPLTATVGTYSPPPVWSAGAALTITDLSASGATVVWPSLKDQSDLAGYTVTVNGTLEDTVGRDEYYYEIGGLNSSTRYAVTLTPFNEDGLFGNAISIEFVTMGRGGMTFTSIPAAVLKTSAAYTNTYAYSYPMDNAGFTLGWNFSNGIDSHFADNLACIRVYNKTTGAEISLNKGAPPYTTDANGYLGAGDFQYTKNGGGSGSGSGGGISGNVRLLEFKPGAATLAQFEKGKTYVVEFNPEFVANNGEYTLGKIMKFEFSIAQDDNQAPSFNGTSLSATHIGPVSMQLNWTAATDNIGLQGYKLTINGTQTITIDATATSYLLTNLTRSTPYSFELRAYDYKNNATAPLALSVSTSAADTVKPSWAVGSILTVKNILTDNLDLYWPAATDDIGVVGYNVYMGGALMASLDSSTLTLHVQKLTPNTGYAFKVEAVDAEGNISTTGPSQLVSTLAGAPDTQAPTWPNRNTTRSTVTGVGSSQVTLQWFWADDNVGVAGYSVYRDGEFLGNVGRTVNSYTTTVIADNSDTTFSIFAFDAAGNVSATSIDFSFNTGSPDYDITPPRWPAGSSITLSDFGKDSVTVSWTQATDDRGSVSYLLKDSQLWTVWMYEGENYPGNWNFANRTVYYNADTLKKIAGLGYDKLMLVEGQPTTFSVKASDPTWNSTMNDPKITFIAGTNPTAGSGIPYSLSNVDNTRGTLNSLTGAVNYVTNPTDPQNTELVFAFGSKLAANYKDKISLCNVATGELIPLDASSLVYAENGSTSTITIKQGALADSASYRVKFASGLASSTGTAIGFDMQWEFKTAVADKIVPTWDASAALHAIFKISPKVATLSWPQASDNVGVTQYKIMKGSDVVAVVPATQLTYNMANLDFSTPYAFSVLAGDYLNNWSAPLNLNVTTPPNTTQGHTFSGEMTFSDVYSDNLTIHWPAAQGLYDVANYDVYAGDSSTPLISLNGDILSYKANNLTGSTPYTFRVVAVDYLGNKSAPLAGAVTTPADTVPPVWSADAWINAKDIRSDRLTVYWTAAADNVAIHHYNVYQDGVLLGSTDQPSDVEYTIKGLAVNTKHTFAVEAVDTNGNKSANKLVFDENTTYPDPTYGSGINFTLESPVSENIAINGDQVINHVTVNMLTTEAVFKFAFEWPLVSDGAGSFANYVKLSDRSTPGVYIPLDASCFAYAKEGDERYVLTVSLPDSMLEMGTDYQLTLQKGISALDGKTLGNDYIWNFTTSVGLYGVKDVAVGYCSNGLQPTDSSRFYLMLKSDGTVWGWGDNEFGTLGDGTHQNAAAPVMAMGLTNIVKVYAGLNSAFALDKDGNVWAWGSNEYGQLGNGTVPSGTSGRYGIAVPHKIAGLSRIVDFSYGFNRATALDSDGNVWVWGLRTGSNSLPYGALGTPAKVRINPDTTKPDFKAACVSTGEFNTLIATADGSVYNFTNTVDPLVKVDGLSEVVKVACNQNNYSIRNLALRRDGKVYFWGSGSDGHGSVTIPVTQVIGAEGVRDIFAESVGILNGGRQFQYVTCDFNTKTVQLGSIASGFTNIAKIATCGDGGLVLRLDGTLQKYTGSNIANLNLDMAAEDPPIWQVPSSITLTNKTENGLTLNWNACNGAITSYAVYQDGELIQVLGNVTSFDITGLQKDKAYTFKIEARTKGSAYTADGPSTGVTLHTWTPSMPKASVAGGANHTLFIDGDGNVWAWGKNDKGQLGIGSNADQTKPVKINGLSHITEVAVGDSHSVALDKDGNVWVFGDNSLNQLGYDGASESSNKPVKVISTGDVVKISAAGNYTMAVKSDGTLWSWGEKCEANLNYAVSGIDGKTPGKMKYGTVYANINVEYSNVKSVACSRNFYAVLLSDGTISRSGSFIDEVGAPTYWTMLKNPGLMGVQGISAGDDFLLALLEDGSVAVLGDNSQGQYGIGNRVNPTPATQLNFAKAQGLTNVAQVSAGGSHAIVMKKDGSVWAWGKNDDGQLGNGNEYNRLVPTQNTLSGVAVGAGQDHAIVVINNNPLSLKAYAFGLNDCGQLGTNSLESTSSPQPVIFSSVTGISLDKPTLSLKNGEKATLTATVYPDSASDKNVLWTTSDPKVASVTDGVVTATGKGTATITAIAEDGKMLASCAVTVVQQATGVALNRTSMSLTIGHSGTLTATVTPDNADNKAVLFTSSNDFVASVDQNGKITANEIGNAIITVTTADGSLQATCAVRVVRASDTTATPTAEQTTPLPTITITPTPAPTPTVAVITNPSVPGSGGTGSSFPIIPVVFGGAVLLSVAQLINILLRKRKLKIR